MTPDRERALREADRLMQSLCGHDRRLGRECKLCLADAILAAGQRGSDGEAEVWRQALEKWAAVEFEGLGPETRLDPQRRKYGGTPMMFIQTIAQVARAEGERRVQAMLICAICDNPAQLGRWHCLKCDDGVDVTGQGESPEGGA